MHVPEGRGMALNGRRGASSARQDLGSTLRPLLRSIGSTRVILLIKEDNPRLETAGLKSIEICVSNDDKFIPYQSKSRSSTIKADRT
jgi:hypothetical protein